MRFDTPADDLIALNRWHRDMKDLVGEVHDVGYDDPAEAEQKLHGLVALCTEQLARVKRRALMRQDAIAREERETSIPPLGAC